MYYALAREERMRAHARRRTLRAMAGTGFITFLLLIAVLVSSTKDLVGSATHHGPLVRFFAWIDPAFMSPVEREAGPGGPQPSSKPLEVSPPRAVPLPGSVSWRTA